MDIRRRAFALVCFSLGFVHADVSSADDLRSAPSSGGAVLCHFDGGEGGCSRFQGYVFVRRRSDNADLRGVSGGGDAALGEQRLYLGVNSQNEH